MIVFPNCKINLGLAVTARRADGYHDLETIFYPVNWCDALEAVEASEFQFSVEGVTVPGAAEDNLCVKAYRLLQQKFDLPPIHLCLLKALPMGAGLGGGSADAAFTLKLLNEMFDLGMRKQELLDFALQLGSDCPFFILNKPAFASGRGELMEPLELDLSSYHILVIFPGIEISTGNAFKNITPKSPGISFKKVVSMPVEEWRELLYNDFEDWAFQQHPYQREVKEELYAAGAVYASMSGSGSAIFGMFKGEAPVSLTEKYNHQPGHLVYKGKMGRIK